MSKTMLRRVSLSVPLLRSAFLTQKDGTQQFCTTMAARKTTLQRQNRIAASYYRGGTSRAVMIRYQDLPKDKSQWDAIFLGVIGSPDPNGRQLDGMGGGISSLSKVVGPPTHPEADVDYTFVSLGIKGTHVDYSSNCGNMSAAVGPYAFDVGLVPITACDGEGLMTVRIHNTNTGKIIHSSFPVVDGEAAAGGNYAIDGVGGTASPIQLRFVKPAGSRTGKLQPTGNVTDIFDGVHTTCIDVGNPCVFVLASELGVASDLTPPQIDDHPDLKTRLESIRRQAGVKMGLAGTREEMPGSVPKIAVVAQPADASEANIAVRAMSVGQPHKAIPVTVALAVAASAKLQGSTVFDCVARTSEARSPIIIQHASGTLAVGAEFAPSGDLSSAAVFRTARRLMEGEVFWK